MKAGLLTVAALAVGANAAVRRDFHNRLHQRHAHHKRQAMVVETQVEYVTATAPQAIVYVDGSGNPVSTEIVGAPAYTPPVVPAESSSAPQAPAYTPPAYTPVPSASSTRVSKPKPTSSTPSNGGGNSGRGVSYAPYNADSTCKTQDQVNSDFDGFTGYGLVRIYGTDCEQCTTVLSAAKAHNMSVFAGIFDISQVQSETQTLIDAVNGDWSIIDTVSVGNELVNQGTPAASVIAALNTARGMLQSAGYTGPVVTVDTFVAMIANPSLCEASDYAAANCHAFFDSNIDAAGAGAYVKQQAELVGQACGGKRVVITETGWPWQGESNGLAVPSRVNQQAAIDSLKSNFTDNVFLFSAYDDLWKQNFEGSFGCEQYWGFLSQ